MNAAQLRRAQEELAAACPLGWDVPAGDYVIGGCFVCFLRRSGGRGLTGEPGWAGATLTLGAQMVSSVAVAGVAGGAYEPGLLALREGPLLEAAVRGLPRMPDVLLVNATGRDHPRGAGLALQLGAVLEVPTVGVTHRPLLACGGWPSAERGAHSPLQLGGRTVGCWLRTRPRARPLAVHPGWRTDMDTACAIVLDGTEWVRAPEALRQARRVARLARAGVRLASGSSQDPGRPHGNGDIV